MYDDDEGSQYIFRPHSEKQQELVLSNHDITAALTGTQWGKSIAASMWMSRQIHTHSDDGLNFILAAPTYKIMNQSMLPYFLEATLGIGKFNRTDAIFEMRGRRRVFFRTESDPNSIVGIPMVAAGWLDEAGLIRRYFWDNYQARAASKGAKTLLTSSPYDKNWVYFGFVKPAKQGKLSQEIKVIQAASWENPYHSFFDPEKLKKARQSMDERRFDAIYGGQWGKMAGTVYDCFDEDRHSIEECRLPTGTVYYGGVDWGHTEPFVIVIRAVTPDGMHYQVSEFYKTGLTVPQQLEIAKQKAYLYDIKQFYCGHDRPENILLFNQNHLPAVGVSEKDIQVGTDLHYELIKQGRYKIFRKQNPKTLEEYEKYHYPEPEDLKPDEDASDQLPVGQDDHAMSANRFVTLRTYRSSVKKPFVPDDHVSDEYAETQMQRFKRLMRPQRSA